MKKTYDDLRAKYPRFIYKSYSLCEDERFINISYGFEIEGLTSFAPSVRIDKRGLNIVNKFDSPAGRRLVFLLGMTEVVSYLKAACCPVLEVRCGALSQEERLWWKKLYFNGLGEFFYRNEITPDFDSFLTVCADEGGENASFEGMAATGLCLVPVGGGKDSAVTAELVKSVTGDIKFFTVNSQQARTQTVLEAGFGEDDIVKTYRTISPELLSLNARGFLNGHTPFSAIVAFLSLYCAYLIGADSIILSNEASANEANIAGSGINHQYSKSYEFECDFGSYTQNILGCPIKYFSLLRPFSELQIARKFCMTGKYLDSFRSCNAGSKRNEWCCSCPKCLFVFSMLSAFLPLERLTRIFGENLLDKTSLAEDFMGLVGLSPVKPFECVGTASEVKYALSVCAKKLEKSGARAPALIEMFKEHFDVDVLLAEPQLRAFNGRHRIPPRFMDCVNEMYREVSGDLSWQ